MGDVMQYLFALDITMNKVFEDTSLPVAEQIKQHVFLIHEKLEQLVKRSKQFDGDEVIITKIHVFCIQGARPALSLDHVGSVGFTALQQPQLN